MKSTGNVIKLQNMKASNFSKVDVTVALPLSFYKCANIGWFSLEGLCRQQVAIRDKLDRWTGRNVEWELIILEEDAAEYNPFGYDRVIKFEKRLHRAGCKAVKYFTLAEHLSLIEKWLKIASIANGRIFIIQSPHHYSQPMRLIETYELMKDKNADWCYRDKGYFHKNGNKILYEYTRHGEDVGLDLACLTELVKQVKADNGIEAADHSQWLYQSLKQVKDGKLITVKNKSPHWKKGLHITRLYDNESFVKKVVRLDHVLPDGVWQRVRLMKF